MGRGEIPNVQHSGVGKQRTGTSVTPFPNTRRGLWAAEHSGTDTEHPSLLDLCSPAQLQHQGTCAHLGSWRGGAGNAANRRWKEQLLLERLEMREQELLEMQEMEGTGVLGKAGDERIEQVFLERLEMEEQELLERQEMEGSGIAGNGRYGNT